MGEQELISKQNLLMSEFSEWNNLQAEYKDCSKEWHDCESEKEKIMDECENIRQTLLEMGCCE